MPPLPSPAGLAPSAVGPGLHPPRPSYSTYTYTYTYGPNGELIYTYHYYYPSWTQG
ncbi:MAG TPA: hypothetical protein VKF37_16285 [Chloroflexota bacterium]|nr:hypothetical protein [Chloroflexota bacterium]